MSLKFLAIPLIRIINFAWVNIWASLIFVFSLWLGMILNLGFPKLRFLTIIYGRQWGRRILLIERMKPLHFIVQLILLFAVTISLIWVFCDDIPMTLPLLVLRAQSLFKRNITVAPTLIIVSFLLLFKQLIVSKFIKWIYIWVFQLL